MQSAILTNKQSEFAEEHHTLIYAFLRDFHLSVEEWYGVAAIGFCKAVMRYEPERGGKFTTFAYRVMLNDIRQEMRKARADKRRAVLVSLHSELSEGFTLEETIGYEPLFMEDEPYNAALEFLCSLDMRQRIIIAFLAAGTTQGDIAKRMNVSRGQVTRHVKALREKYDHEFPRIRRGRR